MNDFTIRIHKDKTNNPVLSGLQEITVSGITLLSKPQKFNGVCVYKGNQKKFGYKIKVSKPFDRVSGSHSLPILSFRGEYIDIIVTGFPRYPSFGQCQFAAQACLDGHGYTNHLNKGFPKQLLYRDIEFIGN